MRDFSVSVLDGQPDRVVISGEIDFATAPQIDDACSSLTTDVFVDCAGVDFIDSAGLRALDRAYAAAADRGSSFSVGGLSKLATRIGQLLGLPYVRSQSDHSGA